jgi:hypothetical protein
LEFWYLESLNSGILESWCLGISRVWHTDTLEF